MIFVSQVRDSSLNIIVTRSYTNVFKGNLHFIEKKSASTTDKVSVKHENSTLNQYPWHLYFNI